MLGRGIRELALEAPGVGRGGPAPRVRDAEVGYSREPIDADEHVVRRDVSMNQLERVALGVRESVRCAEARERVGDDAEHDRRRQRRLALAREHDELREVHAVDVVHDEEVAFGGAADVERRDDVRVPDSRGEPGLVEEHADELGIVREVLVEHLDRDEPLELAHASRSTHVDRAHPPHREETQDLVAADRTAFEAIASRVEHQLEDSAARARLEATGSDELSPASGEDGADGRRPVRRRTVSELAASVVAPAGDAAGRRRGAGVRVTSGEDGARDDAVHRDG